MRVAFTGASGTGKTTLAKYITENFPGLPFIEVGSRSVAEEMKLSNPYYVDGTGRRTQFQQLLLKKKVEVEIDNNSFVTDRTTIDQLAYWYIHSFANKFKWGFDRDIKECYPKHSEDELDEYIARAIAHMGIYDLIFWCPVSEFSNFADDPIRVQDKWYHQMHEAIILGLMKTYGFKLVSVAASDLQDRKNIVKCNLLLSGALDENKG